MVHAREVDSRGRPCPLPVIDLAKAIMEVDVGLAVRLLADDPGAQADIPAWCRMQRHELRQVETHDQHQEFVVIRLH